MPDTPTPLTGKDREDLQKIISELRNSNKSKMFDPTISLQWVLGIVGAVFIGIAGWGITTIIGYTSDRSAVAVFQVSVQKQLDDLKVAQQNLTERVNTMSQSMLQQRDATNDMNKQFTSSMAEIGKSLANLDKAQAIMEQRQMDALPHKESPHGEIVVPEKFGTLNGGSLKGDSAIALGR